MCIIEKTKKNYSEKTWSWFSLKPLKKFSRYNSMNKLCRALFKYENERKIDRDNWL